nr:reverse transcriptase domain-containing protein [Tanacetum cinerariifolium]
MSTKKHNKRHRSRRSRSPKTSVFSRIRHERSRSPIRRERSRSPRKMAKEGCVFKKLGSRGKSVSAHSDSFYQHSHSRYTEALSESEDSRDGHWKSRSKKRKSSGEEDDLSQPWMCEETNPFTPRIRYFNFSKTRMPSHVKTYDGSEDPEDHLKIFKAAAKTERWAMPTWCHMFNSTLTGNARVWFDDLQPESIDSYDDLKKAFLENYLQQKKYIKDPIEIHNIKQRDGESTEDFMRMEDEGTKGPMIIEAEIEGYCIHRIMCDGLQTGETPSAAKPIIEERVKVAINPEYPEQTVMIGSTLTEGGHNKLCRLLERNLNIFTWKPVDMTGVLIHIAEHRLNVREGCSPVRQRKRGQAADKNQAIQEEVEKLMRAGIMRDVHYHDWLSNPVMLITELPMLTTPMEKEKLIVYLAAAKETVSAVLMTERKAKQMPIYFVSRALRGPELNYMSMEKLVLALVHVSKRLKGKKEGELHEPWILFTDGSSCTDGSRAGLILTNLEGMEFTYALRFRFDATNNKAEYVALIAGLRISKHMGVKNLQANVDSRLVANQVNGTYVAKEADMIRYLEKGTLPVDVKKARAIKRNSWRFVVVNETLYKKCFLGPWLSCMGPLQAKYALREIHEGSCSMHAGTRSVVAKALQTSYYWPTMHKDARTLIRACQDYQVHKPVPKNPQQKLTPITSPWPFYKWGIDIAGPFPEGPRKVKFLIVAMDNFTKWIEAKPIATITGN